MNKQTVIKKQLTADQLAISKIKTAGPFHRIFECGSRDALDGISLLKSIEAHELHCFECNPDAIALCRKNIANSGQSDRIKLVSKALSDKTGSCTFYAIDPCQTITPHEDGNIGASSLLTANGKFKKEKYVQKAITVEATTLDDYCSTAGIPCLLWMDLQGAEGMVLDGGKQTLPLVKAIFIEVAFRRAYTGQTLFHEVHKRLQKHFTMTYLDLGRWPRWPALYSLIRFGPWNGNALYINKNAQLLKQATQL